MRVLAIHGFLLAVAMAIASASARFSSQEVVDRIVARVENDVILLSDIRALSRYQQFLNGKSETDAQILDRWWYLRLETASRMCLSRKGGGSHADIQSLRFCAFGPSHRGQK